MALVYSQARMPGPYHLYHQSQATPNALFLGFDNPRNPVFDSNSSLEAEYHEGACTEVSTDRLATFTDKPQEGRDTIFGRRMSAIADKTVNIVRRSVPKVFRKRARSDTAVGSKSDVTALNEDNRRNLSEPTAVTDDIATGHDVSLLSAERPDLGRQTTHSPASSGCVFVPVEWQQPTKKNGYSEKPRCSILMDIGPDTAQCIDDTAILSSDDEPTYTPFKPVSGKLDSLSDIWPADFYKHAQDRASQIMGPSISASVSAPVRAADRAETDAGYGDLEYDRYLLDAATLEQKLQDVKKETSFVRRVSKVFSTPWGKKSGRLDSVQA